MTIMTIFPHLPGNLSELYGLQHWYHIDMHFQIALVFQIIRPTSDLRCDNLFLLRATDARIQRMISLFYWSTPPLLLKLNSSGVVFWINKVVSSPPFRIRQVFQICSSELHPNQHNVCNWCCQQVKCLLAGCGFDSPLTNSSTGDNIPPSLTQFVTVFKYLYDWKHDNPP